MYQGFVDSFVSNVDSALDVDSHNAKRPKLNAVHKAVDARFALGADNNAYMQCGLTVLNVGTVGRDLELAPASLYSSDAVKGLKAGLIAAEMKENAKDNRNKDKELSFVADHVKRTFLSIQEVVNFLVAAEPALKGLERRSVYELSKEPLFPTMLRLLLFLIVDRDEEQAANYLPAEVYAHVNKLRELIQGAGTTNKETTAREKIHPPGQMPDWLSSAEEDVAKARRNEETAKVSEATAKASQVQAEQERDAADTQRDEADTKLNDARRRKRYYKGQAVDARRAKENATEAKESAIAAQTVAENARLDAVTALVIAQQRQQEAETARQNAETAQAGAEADARKALDRAEKVSEAANMEVERAQANAIERESEAKRAQEGARSALESAVESGRRAEEATEYAEAQIKAASAEASAARAEAEAARAEAEASRAEAATASGAREKSEEEIRLFKEQDVKLRQVAEQMRKRAEETNDRTLIALQQLERAEQQIKNLEDENGRLKQAYTPTSTSAAISYMHHRGLFGHRAPHEAASTDPSTTDSVLRYYTPQHAALTLRIARNLPSVHLSDAALSGVPSFDERCHIEALEAIGGDFAIDEACEAEGSKPVLSTPRQVRWLPTGPLASEACTASILEHASARVSRVANASTACLSKPARLLMLATAARFKLDQIEPLQAISRAMVDGLEDDLPQLGTDGGQSLVTRPVATIGGRLLLAHDAYEEHAAPTNAMMLATAVESWTPEARRQNAEHRRMEGDSTVFLCPPSDSISFHPAPTPAIGAPPVDRPANPIDAAAGARPNEYRRSDLLRLLRYGLFYATLPTREEVKAKQDAMLEGLTGTAEGRRDGLWNEFHREIAISTDRLFVFVKTLSGLIGDDVDSLISPADEATMRAAKEMREQRKVIAERVTAFHSKLVETLVGGVLKESKLQLATLNPNTTPVVIDGDVRKQINDLASGESGRPFFEANVALRQMVDRSQDTGTSLADFVSSITKIVSDLQNTMESNNVNSESLGATLAELSAPRNSYFILLKADVAAAIRESFDRFTVESRCRGIGRKVSLWELIEGCDDTLSSRFAAFVGHVLIQNRTGTGVSALYVGRLTREVNASSAMVSLQRLCNHALAHAAATQAPVFTSETGRQDYFGAMLPEIVSFGGSRRVSRYSGPINQGGWIGGLGY